MDHYPSKNYTFLEHQTLLSCCDQKSKKSQHDKNNVNSKRGDDFFEGIMLYIITNKFLAIFIFDTNFIILIIFVITNPYDKHIKNIQQRFK